MKSGVRTLIRATATPLASIFGSGFLVIVPILYGAVGKYAVVAMAGVCLLAYSVGSVIRFNIREAEPLFEKKKARKSTFLFERASDYAIVLAYTISVCLYLRILSSFLLGGFGIDSDYHESLVTTAIIVVIGTIGVVKGLEMLERLEEIALWITMLMIVALIIGFGRYDFNVISAGKLILPDMPHSSWWKILTILGGTLIVVQGFETSRYLGETYERDVRIKSSKLSQIVSTLVYLVFIALATPLMHFLGGKVTDTGLILIVGMSVAVLHVPLITAAVMSQFSAAVADTLGGEGNMVEATHNKITRKWAYVIICIGAITLTWSASTLEIIAIASRAFALYYMIQCLVAFTICKKPVKKIGIFILALILAFFTIFAIPAG